MRDLQHFQDYTDRLVATFQANDVTVSPPAGFQDLNLLYNQAHTVFIPAPVEGGGERAVLEARASGVAVEVAADNPKLQVCVFAWTAFTVSSPPSMFVSCIDLL